MSKSPAQFAVRTLRALEVLTFRPTTAPKLADELGVHQRTARRLLSQLQRDGWVSYTSGAPHVYAPTLRMVALAAHVGARSPLVTLIVPAVERLNAATGLQATLSIPAYDATVCVVRSVGEQAGTVPPTMLAPAHCTAAGKVLMAHREAWCSAILAMPLIRSTERTTSDPGSFARELAQIRMNGYAVGDGEHMDGIREVAAPVAGPGGEVLAAIGVSARDDELPRPDTVLDALSDAAREAAAALSASVDDYPLQRAVANRLLASYGLAPINAYI